MEHNTVSVIREYCRMRKIPYKIVHNHGLYIAGYHAIYSLYNFTVIENIKMIDEMCKYNFAGFYERRVK